MDEHVDSLRSKHARLEQMIDDEQHRPMPDQAMVSRLKKEKLRIKDEIERLSHPIPAMQNPGMGASLL
jgi:hypothetical protein